MWGRVLLENVIPANIAFASNVHTYINEILGGTLRIVFPSMCFVCYSLSGVMINLISIKMTNYRNLIYLNLFGVLGGTVVLFFFIESPFYLYKKKNIKKLYETLLKMCKRNYSKTELSRAKLQLQKKLRYGEYFETRDKEQTFPESNHTIDSLNDSIDSSQKLLKIIKPKSEKAHFLLFFSKTNLFVFGKLMTVLTLLQLISGLSYIINKDLGISNIYLSGILVSLFQAIAYFVGSFFIVKFGRKTLNIGSLIIIFLLSLILLAVNLISRHFVPYSSRSTAVKIADTGLIDKSSASASYSRARLCSDTFTTTSPNSLRQT